ncbi:tudor domain-containing protein 7 isoform X1 [Trichechus manatus latirostris]|uniref:Tudor domain-containing protein 7 n=3 Tax=Trichechus manatus latirostris TaxID=127582 RepID=A0A2Y9DDD3_TRIMA|nr:tudor domain-containing protein 7 isoform X1 [Trichechus manatus latirostris]XP_023583256.1 tudor domain-containing protein 7 isoform X1 [Trichechus manatus latirostris]
MLEADLVSKMLRAVLQSHKNGIALPRLQGEYRSLTGDWIPFKQLGYPTLEAYLRSVPAVVRIETSRSGEITCYAVACTETARIAQLVARQRSSKRKAGRQVNCQMRVKKTMPFFLEGKPKATLRQPGFSSDFSIKKPPPALLRDKGNSLGVKSGAEMPPYTIHTTLGSEVFKNVPTQRHVTLSTNSRFSPKASLPPAFQMHLSRTCSKEMSDNLNQTVEKPNVTPPASNTYKMDEVQNRIKEILNKHNNGIWISKLPHFYKELYKEELNQEILQQFEHWPHICTVEKPCSGGQDLLLYPPKRTQLSRSELDNEKVPPSQLPAPKQLPTLKGCPAVTPEDFKEKVAELLEKYSNGLWASALPKAFEDMYKVKFPKDALKNLASLSDVCTVDYISANPQKAILYAKLPVPTDKILSDTVQAQGDYDIKSMIEQEYLQIEENLAESADSFIEYVTVPPLIIPTEASPSVLVVELNNTNEVVIRYVGKDYSAAQELMEDEMKEYYSKNPKVAPVQAVHVGHLLAVNAEEDAWLRAQIISADDNKIKVCYVDYGFSENVEKSKAYKLNPKFCSLPFQATKCKLAGLEVLSDDPDLVKVVETLTCGKIFAVEILDKADIPLVVLYDTSGEDDININATCLKAICDKSLEVHLQVDAMYTNVKVTNICSDGTLYCQVPCKGLNKLNDLLHKIEDYFHCKHMTSEYFISLPFCGKICLFHCKGKWSRVEITNVHSSRALDVQFLDSGTVTSVKVSELREIPPRFLQEMIAIPPQAIKCCLADLPQSIGMWTPDAVLWLRDSVLNCSDCSIKVTKVDETKGIIHIYLFTPKNFPDPHRSINRQITNADLWKHQQDVFLSAISSGVGSPNSKNGNTPVSGSTGEGFRKSLTDIKKSMVDHTGSFSMEELPPPVHLSKPGEHMDVYVPVACHPGYFVIQAWQEIHKLEVLMEEMILYYSVSEERHVALEKDQVYAAKVENKWHRVLLKGILTNGLVSVYELDYGKHELVNIRKVQPLVDMFRKLPFQAVTAQLAGVKCNQWSEEASMVFRNHVEKKPLVALVQTVIENTNPWDRKVVVYLVDTSLPDTDIWIHDFMSEYLVELSKVN